MVAACEDAALVWIESPTNPALEVADIATIAAAAHEAGAYVVVDNTFATPLLQQPLALGADIVVHSATKYLAGHSDALLGALVTADDELHERPQGPPLADRRHPGHPRGLAGPARPAHPAPARRARPGQRPGAAAAAWASTRRSPRSATPASAASSRSSLAEGELAADLLVRKTRLWVHATSLGGVESTFERRRRWKTESPTIPEGLVRMSVGIEDVEDLWADLVTALDTLDRLTRPRPSTGRRSVRSRTWCRGRGSRPSSAGRSSGRRRRRRRTSPRARRTPDCSASARSEAHDLAPSATWRVEA